MPHTWDPARYLTYADERGRPFVELLARVAADDPRSVVDLGCGPGHLTRLLAQRWPDAAVLGLDASPDMVERARADVPELAFEIADLREWHPPAPVDVVLSNATLQWVDGHLDLLPRLLGTLAPGGWLAFQVPGNFGEPSHELRRELADEPAYAAHTTGLPTPASHDPADYYDALSAAGATDVDVWETTYTHVLSGPDPVFTWVSATGARPTLQALPDDLRADFERDFKARLTAAYPTRPDGTVLLAFRRVFAVARAGREGERGWGIRLHHVQLACPPGGEDVARRFWVDGLGLSEVDKPADLVARGGAWFRAYAADGSTSAEVHVGVEEGFVPARKAHPALHVSDVAALEILARRLGELGYEVDGSQRDTFPGFTRLHTADGHGNRVELLAR